jgi:hypothetical protein
MKCYQTWFRLPTPSDQLKHQCNTKLVNKKNLKQQASFKFSQLTTKGVGNGKNGNKSIRKGGGNNNRSVRIQLPEGSQKAESGENDGSGGGENGEGKGASKCCSIF